MTYALSVQHKAGAIAKDILADRERTSLLAGWLQDLDVAALESGLGQVKGGREFLRGLRCNSTNAEGGGLGEDANVTAVVELRVQGQLTRYSLREKLEL